MSNGRKHPVEAGSQHLLDEGLHMSQEALHAVLGNLRKLRLLTVLLVALCFVLATLSLKAQGAASRLLHLEQENQTKDATIERLQQEMRQLEEKLTYKRKVDGLVAQIQKEAAGLDQSIIRPVAEMALSHTSDPALYLAIGLVEAELRARVIHTDGVALGMHGLCPKDWHTFLKAKGIMSSRSDYFDPVKSFQGSEAVLSALVREYGTLEKALLFYNGGGAAAAGMIPRSKAYMRRVLRLRELFAAPLNGPPERPA